MKILLALLALVVVASAVRGEELRDEVEVEYVRKAKLRYILDTPAASDSATAKHPLVIFLHGAGERGNDLSRVKVHGPHRYIAEHKLDCYTLSPQCDERSFWEADALDALVDHIVKSHPIDESRIYLTGLSMGGYGSWALAAHAPDRYAAVAPICGGGNPLSAARLKDVPIWVFHGAKDSVVRPENSDAMVSALKAQGSSVKYTLYPDAEHDSWTETYNDPSFYQWLFAQRKS